MSSVAALFIVYPREGATDDAEASVRALGAKVVEREEMGFGIMVLKALFTFDDSETSTSEIEDKIKRSDGVSEVEVREEGLV